MLHVSYLNELVMRLDCQILLKSPPPKHTGWIRPCPRQRERTWTRNAFFTWPYDLNII